MADPEPHVRKVETLQGMGGRESSCQYNRILQRGAYTFLGLKSVIENFYRGKKFSVGLFLARKTFSWEFFESFVKRQRDIFGVMF